MNLQNFIAAFISFTNAFLMMITFAAISALADDLTLDQLIERDVGKFSIDVELSDRDDCRRVYQRIEDQWYIVCKGADGKLTAEYEVHK